MTDQTRARGRPRTGDAIDPADILETAIEAFSRGGYEALSMRAVARSLGVSLATVQHHFGTKAELYRAVVDHALTDADQQRSMIPERDLRQRVRNALDASAARPGLLAAFLGDRAEGHEERLAYFAERFQELFSDPAAIVADLQSGHRGRNVDPQAFMTLLTIGVTTMAGTPDAIRATYGIDLSDPVERSAFADALTDILAHGLYETGDGDKGS